MVLKAFLLSVNKPGQQQEEGIIFDTRKNLKHKGNFPGLHWQKSLVSSFHFCHTRPGGKSYPIPEG
jgi:hypothetical protein